MPSRRSVALILAFWLAVTGYVGYRDVWPLLSASGPPPVAIDLADEAAQRVPIRWTVMWNGQKVGKLLTQMTYLDADDTFRFTNTYKHLRRDFGGMTVVVPEFRTVVRVTRGGDLREQSAEGRIEVHSNDLKLADATVKLDGTVADGQLTTRFEGTADIPFFGRKSLARELDPVPVPRGQPLNPMQPVSRVGGLRAGRRWVVHESDALKDVLHAVLKELGFSLPDEQRGPLFGEVLAGEQELAWQNQGVACRVIEYRRDGVLEVRTWVRAADGKVLKQEAFQKGEALSVERDD